LNVTKNIKLCYKSLKIMERVVQEIPLGDEQKPLMMSRNILERYINASERIRNIDEVLESSSQQHGESTNSPPSVLMSAQSRDTLAHENGEEKESSTATFENCDFNYDQLRKAVRNRSIGLKRPVNKWNNSPPFVTSESKRRGRSASLIRLSCILAITSLMAFLFHRGLTVFRDKEVMARLPSYASDGIILMRKSAASMFLDPSTRYPRGFINPVVSGGGPAYGVEVPPESPVSAERRRLKGKRPSEQLATEAVQPPLNASFGMKLFVCGTTFIEDDRETVFPYLYGVRVMADAYPDFITGTPEILSSTEHVSQHASPDDFMIIFWQMYNCEIQPDDFPGKTVVFSGESPPIDVLGKRVYYMGPNPDDIKSIMTPYVTMRLNLLPYSQKLKMFDPILKPKNSKKNFLIYAASHCVDFREDAFDALSEIDVVHRGGECWGNRHDPKRVIDQSHEVDRWHGSNGNHLLYSNYRFSLVMENTYVPGYISEKIMNAYLGGSIPIWFGTKEIFAIFNPKSFIYYDVANPQIALDQIRYLESHPEAYEQMLNEEPILMDGHRSIDRWFSFGVAPDGVVGRGWLQRRIRSMMGYESPMYHKQLLRNVHQNST